MKTKRLLALVLPLAMIVSTLPAFSLTTSAVETTRSIMLESDHIEGGQASNIYFGTYPQNSLGTDVPAEGTEGVDWIISDTAVNNNQGPYYSKDPIKWRALSSSDEKAVLLSDQSLDTVKYHVDREGVTWEKSTVRSWLNGYRASSNTGGANGTDYANDSFISSAFSVKERNVIDYTSFTNDKNPTYGTDGGKMTLDRVFLLSLAEANNTSYFTDDNSRIATKTAYARGGGKTGYKNGGSETGMWWLRSPGYSTDYAALVYSAGNVNDFGEPVSIAKNIVVRPAFVLNFSSVLFTSAAEDGKPDGFNAVSDYSGNDWKLTILDSSRSDFSASVTSARSSTKIIATVSYSNAATGTNEYISAMIMDINGNVTYYGRLKNVANADDANGTLELDLSGKLNSDDTLYIFNEQYNGDYKTDYASELKAAEIPSELNAGDVAFETNGGTINSGDVAVYVYGTGATLPTEVTRDGYAFAGWYESSDFSGNAVTEISTTDSGDKIYYAKWTPNTYNVTLNTNGGTINSGDVTAYTYGVAAALPTDITKGGYAFSGWYEDSDFSGNAVTEIGTTDIGDKTYYAKWGGLPAIAPTISSVSDDLTGDNALTYGEITAGTELTVTATATANGGIEYDELEYQWYKLASASSKDDATAIPGATSTAYTIPTDTAAGDYYYYCTVTATRTDNSEIATADTEIISVTVNKLPVKITWQNTEGLVYDGNKKTITATLANKVEGDTVNLTVTGESATNKGTYTAKVTDVDNKNYTIDGGVNLVKEWAISETTNEWDAALDITGWTYGDTPNAPTAEAKFGTVVFTYSDSINGAYTETPPTAAGTWYVKATVAGTESYAELVSEAKEFLIEKKELNADNIIDFAAVTYTSEEIKPAIEAKDGETVLVLVLDTDYEVSYQDNINVGIAKVIITFKGNYKGTAEKEFTILPKTISTEIPLTAPAGNAEPQTEIQTDEYTATVVWSPEVTDKFAYSTAYTATITIIPKANYTLTGILENNYTANGAETVANEADSGIATIAYAETGRRPSSGGLSRHTVKFKTNGGSTIENKIVTRNTTLNKPAAPTKDGYSFIGWFTDEELTSAYDFDSKVTKGFTLYAKWAKHDDEKPVGFENPFTDVRDNDWYYEDVMFAVENGLFNGTTESIFAPNTNITRAMLVTVLYRAEGEPATNRSIPFADVDMSAYYADAVIWAKQHGIVSGVYETVFAPDENITREQIATIFHRYAEYKGYDVSVSENTNILSYDDYAQISEYAIASMQYALGSGLMKGKTESTLNPKDFAARAEIAAILRRFIEANK